MRTRQAGPAWRIPVLGLIGLLAAPCAASAQSAGTTGAGAGSSPTPSSGAGGGSVTGVALPRTTGARSTLVAPGNGGVAGTGLGKMSPQGDAPGTGMSVPGPAGQALGQPETAAKP